MRISKLKIICPKEKLEELYCKEMKTQKEIDCLFGFKRGRTSWLVKKYGLKKNCSPEIRLNIKKNLNKEILTEL